MVFQGKFLMKLCLLGWVFLYINLYIAFPVFMYLWQIYLIVFNHYYDIRIFGGWIDLVPGKTFIDWVVETWLVADTLDIF